MSALSAALAILVADTATLVATATGGIYTPDTTGRLGINRGTVPGAFDSTTGNIKPCILLKLRSAIPDGLLRDDANQYSSVRQIIECWFYQHSGYATIETMRDRVYALLHARQLAGTFQVFWQGDIRGGGFRDLELDASVERSEYLALTKKSV